MSEILDEQEKPRRKQYPEKVFRPIYFIVPIIIFAILFRRMHWPGGNVLMVVGLGALIGHAIAVLVNFTKNGTTTNVGITAFSVMAIYKLYYEYSPEAWRLAFGAAVIVAFVCIAYFRERDH